MNENHADTNSKAFEGFDAFVDQTLKGFGCAGTAIAVIKDGRVILSKGYGYRNIRTQEPVDADTLFAIGSASKAFTSFDLGTLVDEGKLAWDKPVREYLPGFGLGEAYASEHATARDLLSHRTGFPAHEFVWYNSSLSRAELLQRLRHLELNYDFRTEFQYANLMFLAAGCLVESVSGMSWEEYTRQHVFAPLGMTRSNFSVAQSKMDKNAAIPYDTEHNQPKEVPYRDLDAIGPAGSINSCLNDMVKWVMLHLDRGSFDGCRMISEKNLAQILKPTMPVPASFNYEYFAYPGLGDMNYGLAWFINDYRGHRLIQHGGSIDGFLACISFMPDEHLGVICLSNQSYSLVPYLFAYTLYDRLLGLPPIAWDERMMANKIKIDAALAANEVGQTGAPAGKPTHPLEEYVGDYWNPGYGTFRVLMGENGLQVKYNLYESPLEFSQYDAFRVDFKAKFPLVFASNYDGEIVSLSIPLEPCVKDIVFTRVPSERLYTAETLRAYCGKYQMADGSEVVIRLSEANSLIAAVPFLSDVELEPLRAGNFGLKELPGVKLDFHMDERGAITGFDILQPGGAMAVKKI